MSRSNRAAQGSQTPAPHKKKRPFADETGGVRTGWLLAASLFACAVVALATRYGLVRAFGALFAAWGIDATNAHLAPAWAQALYRWHGSIATLLYAAALLALARWLRRLWVGKGKPVPFSGRHLLNSSLAGLSAALLVAALCLLPDSLRPQWPLTAPRLTWALVPLLLLSLLVALGEEAVLKRALFDGLRARWSDLWAAAVVVAVFFVMNGGYAAGIVGAVNVLLLGIVGCLLYARWGLWAAAGFRWAWSAANRFLLGFGGGDSAVYRFYAVSETPLTGGDAGPVCGLWTTLLLAGLIAALWRYGRNTRRTPETTRTSKGRSS